MEIKTMSAEELKARNAEIAKLIDTEDADLDALEAEVRAINEELETRATEEAKRVELREMVANGAIETEIIEEREIEEMVETRDFSPSGVDYRNAWLKNLAGLPLDAEERSAMATVDVIPTITENKIINRLKENSLLKYIDFTQYKGFVNIPAYTTNGDAAWNSANEQQDAIGHVALSLYQLIKTVEVPAVYSANAIDAFEDAIVTALANKIESALQKAVIVGLGAGSSQPTGINVTHSTADGTFTHTGMTKADILGIMGELGAEYQKDAVWIMPNKVFYESMAVCDLPGFVALNAELKPIIGGKPVVIDDECIISSTDTVFYGCGKAYHLNMGGGVKVDRDDSIGFKTGAVNFRGLTFADGKLDNVNAFVKFTRATA